MFLPWYSSDPYASTDRADYVLEDGEDHEPPPLRDPCWPFATAAEARASLRRQARTTIAELRRRPRCHALERELREFRERHTALIAVDATRAIRRAA